jgi:hypothetical protein
MILIRDSDYELLQEIKMLACANNIPAISHRADIILKSIEELMQENKPPAAKIVEV